MSKLTDIIDEYNQYFSEEENNNEEEIEKIQDEYQFHDIDFVLEIKQKLDKYIKNQQLPICQKMNLDNLAKYLFD